jgi:4-carboxymuconolactone decarboxylase
MRKCARIALTDGNSMADESDLLGGRLPLADPATLTRTQQALVDRVRTDQLPRTSAGIQIQTADGRLIGPFNAFLLRPEVGDKFLEFASASQGHTSLPGRVREVVVLTVGAVWGAVYELYAHSILAREAGVPEHAIKTLARGMWCDALSENEKLAARVARRLSVSHRIDEALYREAEEAFGQQGLFDICALVGRYHTLCTLHAMFQVPAPE